MQRIKADKLLFLNKSGLIIFLTLKIFDRYGKYFNNR